MANPDLTKNQLIINALEHMDVGMLDILLDDEKTYQCATKEVFLQKLSKLFKNFQQENDSFFSGPTG
jgi:myosin heavy subunit